MTIIITTNYFYIYVPRSTNLLFHFRNCSVSTIAMRTVATQAGLQDDYTTPSKCFLASVHKGVKELVECGYIWWSLWWMKFCLDCNPAVTWLACSIIQRSSQWNWMRTGSFLSYVDVDCEQQSTGRKPAQTSTSTSPPTTMTGWSGESSGARWEEWWGSVKWRNLKKRSTTEEQPLGRMAI